MEDTCVSVLQIDSQFNLGSQSSLGRLSAGNDIRDTEAGLDGYSYFKQVVTFNLDFVKIYLQYFFLPRKRISSLKLS